MQLGGARMVGGRCEHRARHEGYPGEETNLDLEPSGAPFPGGLACRGK